VKASQKRTERPGITHIYEMDAPSNAVWDGTGLAASNDRKKVQYFTVKRTCLSEGKRHLKRELKGLTFGNR